MITRDITVHNKLFKQGEQFDYYYTQELKIPCKRKNGKRIRRTLLHYMVFCDALDFDIRSDAAIIVE